MKKLIFSFLAFLLFSLPVKADTLIVYPDASSGGTTVDGLIWHYSNNNTWANIHGGAGTDGYPTLSANIIAGIDSASSAWSTIYRSIFTFDTSSILESYEIDSATFSVRGYTYSKTLTDSFALNVYSSAPASNNNVVAGDYDSLGTTELSSDLADTSFNASGYNDFTLNASGIANITKGGISKFGLREANYDATNTQPTYSVNHVINFRGYYADQTGTTYDPKLTIEYTPPATDDALFFGINF